MHTVHSISKKQCFFVWTGDTYFPLLELLLCFSFHFYRVVKE